MSAPPSGNHPAVIRETGQDNAIVFVHGILGNSDTTWRNGETGASWAELIAGDSDFTRFDIYTVGYESPAMGRTSTTEEVAQRVLQQLRDFCVFDRHTRVHFIAHSMGGLVVKRMLLQLNRPTTLADLRRVKTVVFLSTPSQGAPAAELGTLLSVNPQFRDMTPGDLNSFLQLLENQWQDLLQDREVAGLELRSYCAYETLPTRGVMIVGRLSAASRCDNTPYPVDLDHVAIAKPGSARADPPWAKARILESRAATARTQPPAATPPPTPQAVSISDGQRFVLRERLQAHAGNVVRFVVVGGDPYVRLMFEQLIRTFSDAGWKPHVTQIGTVSVVGVHFPQGPYMTGVNISAPIVEAVFSAFRTAAINLPLMPSAFMGPGGPADVVIVLH